MMHKILISGLESIMQRCHTILHNGIKNCKILGTSQTISLQFASALWSTSIWTMAICPFSTAKCIGCLRYYKIKVILMHVLIVNFLTKSLHWVSTHLLSSSNNFTTSICPFSAAWCKAVLPSLHRNEFQRKENLPHHYCSQGQPHYQLKTQL